MYSDRSTAQPVLLVLGAASPTGRSLTEALRASRKYGNAHLIGGDLFENAYATAEERYDTLVRMPRYDTTEHVQILRAVIERYDVDACLVLAELEVIALSGVDLGIPTLLPDPAFCRVAASKQQVFSALQPKGLAPRYVNHLSADNAADQMERSGLRFPIWVRSAASGTTSGVGSFLARSQSQLDTWLGVTKLPDIQAAELLPGRNWACLMIYRDGALRAFGIYERLAYLMARSAPSGVTGNISKGQIKFDQSVLDVSLRAIDELERLSATKAHGFLTIDLKETSDGQPLVTEVNLKPVACVGTFCHQDLNLAEIFVDCMLDSHATPSHRVEQYLQCYGSEPIILRDVDGGCLLVDDVSLPGFGEEVRRPVPPSWWVHRGRQRDR